MGFLIFCNNIFMGYIILMFYADVICIANVTTSIIFLHYSAVKNNLFSFILGWSNRYKKSSTDGKGIA